jgi:hypothetical protein
MAPSLVTPPRFLFIGGATLLLLGALGATRVLGTLSTAAVFHPPAWINWVHLAAGSIVLAVAWRGEPRLEIALTALGACLAMTLGLGGLFLGPLLAPRDAQAPSADPSDHLAHLLVGLTAIWALLGSR